MPIPAPAIIQQLIDTFEQNLDSYHSRKNETELRREFLDKFFAALGWDVTNEKGLDEASKEVVHEFSVEVQGQGKKADYAFRAGNAKGEKFDFLVEAKKPSVKVESSIDAAFQLRRYGWSAKLPVNILTDFEHLAIYDCRVKPVYGDLAAIGRDKLIHYKEFVERWDEIAELFSYDAVQNGALAKYAESTNASRRRGTISVDDAFLEEIERWRDMLAKNIALRNKAIDIAGLNYAVQMTIDRIVFLRICEERDIEPEKQLLDIVSKSGTYQELCALFKRADTKYNSGLFHFKDEKGESSRADDLTLTLAIDDDILQDIISNLYYPKSPYAFLYIPSDILGQVYERFLGKVIRLTAEHQAEVEEKPEVRKAGGVYYTPSYIVEYIVKNTVGKLVSGEQRIESREQKTGKTMTPVEVAKLKVVDPACGSGSFLLGAYQFLLDWHLDWYSSNDPEKWIKNKILVKVGEGYRLTTAKKKEILLNNIHGVDIDAQAVEVTKLSLLLKVLENASGQLGLGLERVLPDLGENIKCGNSLIGFDYFEGQLFPDEAERARVNPFDWRSEFRNVFANGGFDAVIGNPPYLFITELDQSSKKYYFEKYLSTEYRFDIYGLFTELSVKTLLKDGGYVSFIIPHTLLSNNSFEKLRRILLTTTFIEQVVDIGPGVFETAKNETMIFIVRKGDIATDETTKAISTTANSFPFPQKEFKVAQKVWNENKDAAWLVKVSANDMDVVDHFEKAAKRLGEICTINQGLRTGDNEKYLSDHQQTADWKPAAGGKHVGRYEQLQKEIFVYYIPKELDAPRKPEIFDSTEKIVVQEIRNITLPRRIIATYDNEQFYCLQSTNVINLRHQNGEWKLKYLLGIMNSNVANYFFRKRFSGNNHIASNQLAQIPIPVAEKAQHDKMVNWVEQMLALHKAQPSAKTPQEKERLSRQIEAIDRSIDALVYKLYGLSEAEIAIVEGKV